MVLIVTKILTIKIKKALIMITIKVDNNCKNMETSVVTINSFKNFQIAT